MNRPHTSLSAHRPLLAACIVGALLWSGCAASVSLEDSEAATTAPTNAGSTGGSDASVLAPTTMPGSSAGAADDSSGAPSPAAADENIDWEPCGKLECGTVAVPVDRNDESLGELQIAVNVRRATKPAERIGYLFVNPGGPGVSGIEFTAQAAATFGDRVTDRFDIVGFDPRGVGESEPTFECGDGSEQRDLLKPLTVPLDEAEIAAGEEAAQLCADSMGPVASRLGSSFVADDMDAIREALGAETISYIGYSYGSALGTWYASAYPTHVRAMVLDGASEVVTDISTPQVRLEDSLNQIAAFNTQLTEALAACTSADCPIYNDGDPTAAYYDALEHQDLVTAKSGDPDTTGMGIVSLLYSEQTRPLLWQAIADLRRGDPSAIIEAAKFQQKDDGADFTETVNCLDSLAIHPDFDRATQLADFQTLDEAATQQFPLLAAIDSSAIGVCPFLDELQPSAASVKVDGGGVPILVIGNHSDPVTSFSESERLATEVLSNGYLVDTDHYQHTVFPKNDCVNTYVYDMLFDQKSPTERVVKCDRQDPEAKTPQEALDEICAGAITTLDPPPAPDEETQICERFVELAVDGKTDAELEKLANPTDDATIAELSTVFGQAVDEVMGS